MKFDTVSSTCEFLSVKVQLQLYLMKIQDSFSLICFLCFLGNNYKKIQRFADHVTYINCRV